MSRIRKERKIIPLTVKVSISYAMCSILQKCLSFITLPLFTRLLTTEQYGQYSIYASWSAILAIFITLNLSYGSFSTAMVKFEDKRELYISSIQGIGTFLATIFLIVYFPLRIYWNRLFELPTFLIILMVIENLANLSIGCWSGKKRFEFRYKSVIAVTLLSSICAPIIAYFFVINSEEKGYARIFGYAIVSILFGGWIYIYNFRKGKKIFIYEFWKYALGFNIPLIPYYLSQVIFNQSDRIMISHYCGVDKAGIYGVAYSLATILNFILNAINNSYVPWLYEKVKNGNQKENREVSCVIAVIIAVLLLGIIVLGPEIIFIMAGKDYQEAIWIVPPVAMSILLMFYTQLFVNIEFYYEEKQMLVYGAINAAVLNIILNVVLIPRFGYIAAGYTTLASYAVFSITNYYLMKKAIIKRNLSNDAYNIKALIIIFVVFTILSSIIMTLYSHFLIRYLLVMVVLLLLLLNRRKIIKIYYELKKN